MNKTTLQTALQDIPLGGLRYFEQVGSTNDIALTWAEEKSARDFSLVIANEQIAGRGRNGRKWQTPPDSALALSLLLLPSSDEARRLALFTALGALALTTALEKAYALKAEIKWPNDVLVNDKKIAGILVEANWIGNTPTGIVLGMGINIRAGAVPPPAKTLFPATCLENALGAPVARLDVLAGLLHALVAWRPRLGDDEMIAAWDNKLAFRSEQVSVQGRDGQIIHGRLLGINKDGSLRLDTHAAIHFGDVHLRPSRV